MNTQLPTINFPRRGEVVEDEFVTQWETSMDTLQGNWTASVNVIGQEVATNKDLTQTAMHSTHIARDEVLDARDVTLDAKNEAVLAKNEIKSYVIPTEATYSPETIEAKLDMAETLNLVGA